ncbi:hypothetical protein [Ruminococcus sp. HUN007]|uniref:hypothetical protein n=1 Tax=Ruminococcus sp. HUN007 TaxID=1514668 RepID=UPI0005D1EBBE|nr:hypothetical protein [Ruminococcus sp. HUN007]
MNIKKLTSMTAALGICLAITGCGDTGNSDTDVKEKPSETTAAKSEETPSEESEANSEESKAEEVSTNNAENEIRNANLRSGYVKIDDDLFRDGGYYTVRSLYEEYNDRYIISVNDEYMESNPQEYFDIEIQSQTDPSIILEAQCVSSYNNAKTVGDSIVAKFDAKGSNTEERMMYPGGLTFNDNDMTEEEILPFLQSLGMSEAPVTSDYFVYDGYEYVEPTENIPPYYYFHIKGSEQNLLGEYPVFGFKFIVDSETNKVKFGPWGVDSYDIEGKWKSANNS